MPNIDLNSLLRNDNSVYALRILPPASSGADKLVSGGLIKGFLTNSLSWSSSNTWEGLHQGFSTVKGLEKELTFIDAMRGQFEVGEAATENAGIGSGQHAIQGITESIARYTGSQKPTFSFNMFLVNLTPQSDIITPIKILLKGCYPQTAVAGTMEAPYGYLSGFTGGYTDDDTLSGQSRDTAVNVWQVQIGKWFRCNKLILDSCNVNFSQQCTPTGQPLFAEVQLVFETWRLITAAEVDSFFGIAHSEELGFKDMLTWGLRR